MGIRRARPTILVFTTILLLASAPVDAQRRSIWPDKAQDLQVLPKDTTPEQLRDIMRSFAMSLGVRCSYCHVGEEGKPLTTYDFASNENPHKAIARHMVRMLNVVNDTLRSIDFGHENQVQTGCVTCHRGRPRPFTLGEELDQAYSAGGTDAALKRYDELRTNFYGRGSYDFGETALVGLGHRVQEGGLIGDAIRIFELNVMHFPESSLAYDSLGGAYLANGDQTRAIEAYRRALEIDPQNRHAATQIEKIEKPQGR